MTKSYATVADKSAGDFIIESDWDNYIKTNINNLIVPPACTLHNSSSISVSNGGFNTLTFDNEDIDTDGMHSTVSNTGRITIATTGIYILTASIQWAANATGKRVLLLYVDGTDDYGRLEIPAVTGGGTTSMTINSVPRQLTAGQYAECWVFQDSGGALDINAQPYFGVHWFGKVS